MSRFRSDAVLTCVLRGCGILSGAIALMILYFLLRESIPALAGVGLVRFVADESWHPSPGVAKGQFNLVPMIVGTSLATVGAVLLAAPLGIGSAVFAHYYAPRPLGRAYGKVIELLAGIPSVVYGLWGLVVLVPLIARWHPPGTSLLSAIIILTIMILPTIALLVGAAFDNLPQEYLRASAALGLSRGRTVLSVVLPAVRSSLFTAMLLGTGRAIGETMAVLMVAGNVVQIPGSIFHPVRTITSNIALEMSYAMGEHRSALFVCGLVLMSMVIVLVGIAEWAGQGRADG